MQPGKDISALYGMFEEKKSYNREEVVGTIKKWLDRNQNVKSLLNKPASIEFGDIILFNIAGRLHPCIIFKKLDGTCYAIVTSTKDHEHHFLSKIEKSRVFRESFFTITVISVTEQFALDNFVGMFDSNVELKQAVRLLKTKYKKVL